MNFAQVVIMTAADEFHKLGARAMVDCLGMDGWDVNYLGAKIPLPDLLRFLDHASPFWVAISRVVLCFLLATQELVAAIKNQPALTKIRLMVGGQLFQQFPALWEVTGAMAGPWMPKPE
jgi:MerR family transcriptional regulator, light-induced transcriptional regulator